MPVNTKLTLTIEKATIEKAKKYAYKRGQSLSGIVENYLKVIAEDKEPQSPGLTPIVESLKGAFKLPENIEYKKNYLTHS